MAMDPMNPPDLEALEPPMDRLLLDSWPVGNRVSPESAILLTPIIELNPRSNQIDVFWSSRIPMKSARAILGHDWELQSVDRVIEAESSADGHHHKVSLQGALKGELVTFVLLGLPLEGGMVQSQVREFVVP